MKSIAHGVGCQATGQATVQGALICESCQTKKTNPKSGRYRFGCLQCCARLVASARPNRKAQDAMLAAIAMSREAPNRDEILSELKDF